MKRFYKEVSTGPRDGGFQVLLDGRPVRTPARALLVVPSEALARAIADEWLAQGDIIKPAAMPLTGLVVTAFDRISGRREDVESDLVSFGSADLICYRAERPAELAALQDELWQPLLDWSALSLDAPLVATTGLAHVAQPPVALAALGRTLASLSDLELVAVHAVTAATGSLVIALAFHAGQLEPRAAFEAGQVDDLYSLRVWGDDAEARRRLEALEAEIGAARRLLDLLRDG